MPQTTAMEEGNIVTKIFHGLERQGPGDAHFTKFILSRLPQLPRNARIADIGCGAGAGTLLLAEYYRTPITAVDIARPLLDQLEASARELGLSGLIRTQEADMGNLGWPNDSIDLLWSEGAAFILTFAGALKTWRPLLAHNGIAVISELSWFTDSPPPEAKEFWSEAYPAIAGESGNRQQAESAGFNVFGTHRLPVNAWIDNYYDPLERRIRHLRPTASEPMINIIKGLEAEMALFRRYHGDYGYTFYLLKAA